MNDHDDTAAAPVDDPGTDPSTGPGRRERKKLATRDALRHAALELFVDRSFASVTVEEVCERADVATSTFFRHFATKEDVVLSDLADRGDLLLAALDSQPEGVRPSELVAGAVTDWNRSRMPSDTLRAEASLLAREPALQSRLDRLLAGWEAPIALRLARRYGYADGAVEPALGAAWIVAGIRVVVREWSQGGSDDVMTVGVTAVSSLGVLLDQLLAGA